MSATEEAIRRSPVDGHDAIIDGTTGGLALPPHETTDADVLGALAHAQAAESAARTVKNKAANAHTAAKKALDAATMTASEHWNRTQQLGLTLTVGGTVPDDEEMNNGE